MTEESIFKLVGTLVVISIISAITLSLVYAVSNPIIEKNKLGELKKSLKEIMPQAEKFEEVKEMPPEIIAEREGIKRVFKGYDKGGKTIGVIVLSDAVGFNDFIRVIFGLDRNGKITQVKILEHLETPGLGDRITEDEFLNQFSGKSSRLENVDAITGATISSTAVIERVKEDSRKIVNLMEKGEL